VGWETPIVDLSGELPGWRKTPVLSRCLVEGALFLKKRTPFPDGWEGADDGSLPATCEGDAKRRFCGAVWLGAPLFEKTNPSLDGWEGADDGSLPAICKGDANRRFCGAVWLKAPVLKKRTHSWMDGKAPMMERCRRSARVTQIAGFYHAVG
jgi:hypothetical protein